MCWGAVGGGGLKHRWLAKLHCGGCGHTRRGRLYSWSTFTPTRRGDPSSLANPVKSCSILHLWMANWLFHSLTQPSETCKPEKIEFLKIRPKIIPKVVRPFGHVYAISCTEMRMFHGSPSGIPPQSWRGGQQQNKRKPKQKFEAEAFQIPTNEFSFKDIQLKNALSSDKCTLAAHR